MQFHIRVTALDYLRSVVFASRRLWWFWLLIASAVSARWVTTGHTWLNGVGVGMAAAGLGGLVALLGSMAQYRASRRDYRSQDWRVTELGVLIGYPSRAAGLDWSMLRRWRESRTVILLYLRDSHQFLILPKAQIERAKLEELRTLLRTKLPD